MIAVSDAWKDVHQRFFLPEAFIEITCGVTEDGLQERATATGTDEAVFSNVSMVASVTNDPSSVKYATNELNLWTLDGSRTILPDTSPYKNKGYISDIESTGSVTLELPEVHTVPLPGVTITWSSTFGEYPSVFTVTAKNGDTVVAETTVTDNTEEKSYVYFDLVNYDSVTVTVHDWFLPHRRARIENVYLGHALTMAKKDIFSYTHEQHGDLLSGEVPKNSIEFSINNVDGRWNPSNPTGIAKYLSERQKVTVRYGFNIDGEIEWIKAGTFYLSEWNAPANGIEAKFVARDLFDFLMNVEMKGSRVDSLEGLAETAVRYNLPDDITVTIDPSLADYTKIVDSGDNTAAEIIQKCANGAACIIRCDREGNLYIEPLNKTFSGYTIPLSLSYTYPELTLSKPLKTVSVDYGEDDPYELSVAASGETQTVKNDFIVSAEQAAVIADWVRDTLETRKTVSGEFRADPRLDLFDVVTVESKYGAITPVVITNIKYLYNGSFRATYTGKVIG